MMWLLLKRFSLVFVLCCSLALSAAEKDLLQISDIGKIMQQIFSQHVDKKEISKDILKNSFKVYLEQFDPEKIYLLESEVNPFVNPTDDEMTLYIEQYKNGDYSAYAKMDVLIEKGIHRAQNMRKGFIDQPASLFAEAKKLHIQNPSAYADPDTSVPFASSEKELSKRIKTHAENFIRLEMRRFGVPSVMSREKQVVTVYDKNMQTYENNYLFLDEGQPFSDEEKENMLSLHILKALAKSLDSHTTFFNAQEAHDMRVHLEKELHGIGVVLQKGTEGALVAQMITGGPAEKSGLIKVNDEIIEVNGKSIVGEPFDKVMELIRGEDGSAITLKLKRKIGLGQSQDKFLTVTLKREPIALNDNRVNISHEQFGNGIIGKLVMDSFYQSDKGYNSEKDLREAIQQLKKTGNLRGLIIDLRENSGGFLNQAIKVSGLFISNGVVVVSKYSSGEEQFYRDIDGKKEFDGPIIILTSKATASAAEIVALALQDYGVALIVGDDRTYGKGSIQSQTVTDDKSTSFFKVTVGKYYTVSGRSPQIRGVIADIVVPGRFSHEHMGEEFLENPLTSDTIDPAFNDDLKDVDKQYKPWFLKYYMPTLQHQTDVWKKMVPVLKKNSEYRIGNNKNYQHFLKKINGTLEDPAAAEDEGQVVTQNNSGTEDLQMSEAVNIMKDMIILHSLSNSQTVGVVED